MIWKSQRQRRLVMALLSKMKEKKSERFMLNLSSSSVTASSSRRIPIMKEKDVSVLLNRLPKKHQELSLARSFHITDSQGINDVLRVPGARGSATGLYNQYTGALYVSDDPIQYISSSGYSSRPSHIPRGSMLNPTRRLLRNAKVGSAKSFYHEFGHSLDSFGSRSTGDQKWVGISQGAEWQGVDSMEAFAETYTQYATSQLSRSRLKRERPESYKYMKRFFEEQ